MKNAKSMLIALLAAALIFAGSFALQAQSVQQATDQTKTDSSTTKSTEKKNADVAPRKKQFQETHRFNRINLPCRCTKRCPR